MRKNSRAVLGLVLLLAACRGGGDTYRKMRLDQQAELARWRALGIRNPSAPPRKPKEE